MSLPNYSSLMHEKTHQAISVALVATAWHREPMLIRLSAACYDPKVLFRVTAFQNTSSYEYDHLCSQIYDVTFDFLYVCSLIGYKWPILAMIQVSISSYLQTLSKFMYFLLCHCCKHGTPLTTDSSCLSNDSVFNYFVCLFFLTNY